MPGTRSLRAWEEAHRRGYGEGSWRRVQGAAWTLTQRRVGYSARDLDLLESGQAETPQARQERLTTWMPAARLLALAWWRAARHADLLVDEVPLTRALWWLGGACRDRLWSDALPPWEPALPGDWARLRQREAELLETTRQIATWHELRDIAENRRLRDTPDGTPQSELLLGDRVRAVQAGPYRDGRPPRWTDAVDHARERTAQVSRWPCSGAWQPGPAVQAAARALHPTLAAAPDAPTLPAEATAPAWIQRAVRLEHILTTIRTVRDHHQQAPELDSHPRHPVGSALAATCVALNDLTPAVRELETLWTHRTQTVAEWERTHLPIPLREHIIALEGTVSALCAMCFDLTIDPDEPH